MTAKTPYRLTCLIGTISSLVLLVGQSMTTLAQSYVELNSMVVYKSDLTYCLSEESASRVYIIDFSAVGDNSNNVSRLSLDSNQNLLADCYFGRRVIYRVFSHASSNLDRKVTIIYPSREVENARGMQFLIGEVDHFDEIRSAYIMVDSAVTIVDPL